MKHISIIIALILAILGLACSGPMDQGFDRYFGHLEGACNYFTGGAMFDTRFLLDREEFKAPSDSIREQWGDRRDDNPDPDGYEVFNDMTYPSLQLLL